MKKSKLPSKLLPFILPVLVLPLALAVVSLLPAAAPADDAKDNAILIGAGDIADCSNLAGAEPPRNSWKQTRAR